MGRKRPGKRVEPPKQRQDSSAQLLWTTLSIELHIEQHVLGGRFPAPVTADSNRRRRRCTSRHLALAGSIQAGGVTRFGALLKQLTTQQKLQQLGSDADAKGASHDVAQGVPAVQALHDMVDSGLGVVYPQIGDEMRAYSNKELRAGRPSSFSNCFRPHVQTLGNLTPTEKQPFSELQPSTIGSAAHLAMAHKLAVQSIVLLKNTGGTLPLKLTTHSKLTVIGSFANDSVAILGNYYYIPPKGAATLLQAMRAMAPEGLQITFHAGTAGTYSPAHVDEDVKRCQAADTCILFLNNRMQKTGHSDNSAVKEMYSPVVEGEKLDRLSLWLNSYQQKLWQALASPTTKLLVVVLVHGGLLDVFDMQVYSRVGAILTAWYPGESAAAISRP